MKRCDCGRKMAQVDPRNGTPFEIMPLNGRKRVVNRGDFYCPDCLAKGTPNAIHTVKHHVGHSAR